MFNFTSGTIKNSFTSPKLTFEIISLLNLKYMLRSFTEGFLKLNNDFVEPNLEKCLCFLG